jgi:hypothetical protein
MKVSLFSKGITSPKRRRGIVFSRLRSGLVSQNRSAAGLIRRAARADPLIFQTLDGDETSRTKAQFITG